MNRECGISQHIQHTACKRYRMHALQSGPPGVRLDTQWSALSLVMLAHQLAHCAGTHAPTAPFKRVLIDIVDGYTAGVCALHAYAGITLLYSALLYTDLSLSLIIVL